MQLFLRRSGADCGDAELKGIKILTEVALIRDAYFVRKPDVGEFMDGLVQKVARQENLNQYRLFTEMPLILRDPSQPDPPQRKKPEHTSDRR
jgi:hypothetical protein